MSIYTHIYMYIYTHIHLCVWQANCVASIAVCTLFRAYCQFLTNSCSRICPYVIDIQIPGARKPSLPLPNHSQKNSCWRPLITAAFVLLWLNVCPEWISEFSCTNIETHCCRMCMVLGTVVGLCWKSRPNRGVWRLAGPSTSRQKPGRLASVCSTSQTTCPFLPPQLLRRESSGVWGRLSGEVWALFSVSKARSMLRTLLWFLQRFSNPWGIAEMLHT